MQKVNALELRQSLGKVLARLESTGEPILLERGRRPVGVIVPLRDYQERFAEKVAGAEREKLLSEMDELARPSADPTPGVEILRGLRGDG